MSEAFQTAMLNVLEDNADEREQLADTHRAMLNMLDDLLLDKAHLVDAEQSLRDANEHLLHLDVLKSEFVAMASHELRTPLTSIAGLSATMLNRWESLNDAAKLQFVGIIDSQAQRLARLVEALLTLSRIESGALTTAPERIDVGDVIAATMQEFDVAGIDVSCAAGLYVRADRDHFQQIIVNFVANSIKHGRPPIVIEARTDGAFVQVSVRDCGDGVPEQFVPQLWERFAQADHDASRHAADGQGRGTGLGLSIVHALAIAQGGDAWYEPNEPAGSCFAVRLPSA